MGEILRIVFSIFAGLFLIETALYLYIKKKQSKAIKWLNKKIKENIIAYLIIFSLFFCYLYFFEERSFYLECQKDAMTCTYFHTTYSNKKMRVIEKYDISQVQYARAKRNNRIGRHGSNRAFYTVELVEKNKSFSLAPHYNTMNSAAKEAHHFNRFLIGNQKIYTVRKDPSSDPFGSIIGFMACLFAIFLEIRPFWDLAIVAFKEYKKEKRRQKENFSQNDDIIQRN